MPDGSLGHARRAATRARVGHDRLRDEGAELRHVEEAVQLGAVGRAAGGGHERVRAARGRRRGRRSGRSDGRHRRSAAARRSVSGRRRRRRGRRACLPSKASQRTRSPRKTGPSTHERTIRVRPSAADDRHDAGHADPDAARHGLLDGDLRDGAVRAGDLGDRPEHAHRAAAVDDAAPGAAG